MHYTVIPMGTSKVNSSQSFYRPHALPVAQPTAKVHRRKAIDQYTKRVGFNLLYNGCKTNANIEVFGVGAEMFHLRP